MSTELEISKQTVLIDNEEFLQPFLARGRKNISHSG